MTSAPALYLFACTALYVGAKASQQLHVCYFQWGRVIPTSFVMALMEVTIVLSVVRADTVWAFLPMGLGGATGSLLAMYLNRRIKHG